MRYYRLIEGISLRLGGYIVFVYELIGFSEGYRFVETSRKIAVIF